MLNLQNAQRGVSLIELLIAVAIAAIVLAAAAPALSGWIQNAQVRTAADAIQNGLQLARGEAVRLNTQVRFQLTSSIDNACTLSTTSSNWVVSLFDPTNPPACGTPPTSSYTCLGGDPCIIQARSGTAEAGSTITASQSTVCFNGLGQQSACGNPVGAVTITVEATPATLCKPPLGTGAVKCMKVEISSAGQIHMCDASLTYSKTTPTGC